MTDAEFDAQQKRVNSCFDFWAKRLCVLRRGWTFDLYFDRYGDDFREGTGDKEGWRTIARSRPQWEYMRGTITFNMPVLASIEDERLDLTMVHEILHFLVAEMAQPDKDGKHEERVVTALALICVRTGKKRRTCFKPAHPAVEPVA